MPKMDDPVAALPPLRDIIAEHDLGARKGLGQHFLLDLNLTRRIARAACPLAGATVIEVGPGPGGLTRALLLEGATNVIAIERDRRCVAALSHLVDASADRLKLAEGDALDIDLRELGPPPRIIVANLPYNVSTAILIKWLKRVAEDAGEVSRMVLMFQSEVADRLLAKTGGKHYGRLSILTQWLCEVRPLFNLPPGAFTPPPKVFSSVVELRPRAVPLAPAQLSLLERTTAAAFGQRRKMLRQSLKGLTRDSTSLLDATGIDGTRRAETLTIEEFCSLARALNTDKT